MTVSSTVNKTQANGNGSTSAFPFAFKFTASSEIEVYVDDTLKTLSTHYTLSSPGDSGTVTFLTSPTDFRPQSGEVVTIRRIQPLTQTFDPTAGGGLSSSSVEGSDDNLLMKIQQIDEQSDRAPRLKPTTETGQLTFPEPAASAVIAYNAAGTDLETKGLADIGGITTPVSATDEAIVRFDGTSGLSFQNSGVTIDDSNNVAGVINLTQTGYTDLTEIAEPGSPGSNVARIFARDVSGKTHLSMKDATGTVIDLFRGIVSVKDFGALGDDSPGDAAKIQAAIDWCESLGGGLIFSPPGDYRLEAGLVNDSGSVSFIGAGVDAVTWILDDAVNESVLTFSQVNAGYFAGITIDGNRANQTTDGDGITLDRCNNVIIERFYIQDAYRYGIGVTGAAAQRRNKILNGFIEDTGAHGIFINDDDTHTKEAVHISGMFVQRPGRNASLSDQACYYITGWSVISDSFAREFEDVAATRGFWFAEGDDSPSVGANNSTAINCHARGVTFTAGNVGFLMDARHIKLVGCFASELGTGYFWRQQDGSAVACHAHRGRHGFVTEDSSGFDTNGDKISLMNCVAALQSSGVTDGVGFLIGGDDNQLVGCDVRDKNYGVDIESSAANTRVIVLEANNITTAVVRDGGSNSILDFIPDISPTGRLQTWRVLAASAVAASITGSTSETILATIPIPAGAMGANGMLRIVTTWTVTNSADDKTPRVRLGGIGGTAMLQPILTTSASARFETIIQNRNSAASQVGFARSSVQSFTNSSSANTTATINTAVAQDLVITGQNEVIGDTSTLESYSVEIFYQA